MIDGPWKRTPYYGEKRFVVREEKMIAPATKNRKARFVTVEKYEDWAIQKEVNTETGDIRWIKLRKLSAR